MPVDSSIYFQQQPIDILGNVQKGMALGQNIQDRKVSAQDLKWKNEAQAVYGLGIKQNPDGSTTFDQNAAMAGMQKADPNNPYIGKMAYDMNQSAQQRAFEQQKYQDQLAQQQIENQRKSEMHSADMAYKRAQTSELNRKPSDKMEIKTNQATAAGFGRRLQQAESTFDELSKGGYSRAGFGEALGSAMPNVMKGASAQRQEQAERNFVNAVLRRESGAAISPSEFESAELQYFPRFGDSAAVIAQKKANREQAGIALKAEAGRAWDRIPLAANPNDPIPPKAGKVDGGYRFKGGDPSDPNSWEKM